MAFIDFHELEQREPIAGFRGYFVHGEKMTVTYWTAQEGASFPDHSHLHEQVTNIVEGEFELNLDGETRVLGPGSCAVIPSNAVHGGRAITACKIIDAFSPVREDYR